MIQFSWALEILAATALQRRSLDLKDHYVGNIELGIKILLENATALYIGGFMDYGLNNLREVSENDDLIEYQPKDPAHFSYSSLIYSQNQTNQYFVDKVRTIAFGLKIRYALMF